MKNKYIISFIVIVIIYVIILLSRNTSNKNAFITIKENYVEIVNRSTKNFKLFDINLNYTINSEPCQNNTELLAIFIVTSYFGNVETRSAMRRAFPLKLLKELNLQRIFLLGQANDSYTDQKSVVNEHSKFQDIVQGNFKEAYRNLTYKHIMGLKWATDFCSNAKFIIKMDDDIVVNVREIVNLLKTKKLPNKNILMGYVLRGMVPKREPANKWYVTNEEYSESIYPPFVSGWLYVTTPQVATMLLSLVTKTKYFWVDDVYVTGVLARILRIKHFDINQYYTVNPEFFECCIRDVKKHNFDCDILVGPNGGDNNLFYTFNSAMKICSENKCLVRKKPLNDTCVAERKINIGRGSPVIKNYKLH